MQFSALMPLWSQGSNPSYTRTRVSTSQSWWPPAVGTQMRRELNSWRVPKQVLMAVGDYAEARRRARVASLSQQACKTRLAHKHAGRSPVGELDGYILIPLFLGYMREGCWESKFKTNGRLLLSVTGIELCHDWKRNTWLRDFLNSCMVVNFSAVLLMDMRE